MAHHHHRSLFYIQSELNGKVLDVFGQQTCPGTKVIVWEKNCPQTTNQLWYLDNENNIHSGLNDFVLQSSGCGTDIKVHPSKGRCQGGDEQHWQFDCKKIVNKKICDQQCLDIRQSNQCNGADVISYKYHGGANQHWIKVPVC